MATAPVKSQQPLHNFSLPGFLSWGGATSSSSSPSPSHPHPHRNRRPPPPAARAGGSSSSSPPPPPPPPDDESDPDPESRPPRVGSRPPRSPGRRPAPSEQLPPPEWEHRDRAGEGGKGEEAEAAGRRPWNLRPRRAAANPPPPALPSRNGEPFPDAAYGAFGGDKENYAQPPQPKSVRLRGFAEEGERKEKRKFWISLSKEEIEEDIFIMTGSRPARRPRKRPKNEQKQLDIVFPGLWLVGLTADAYRVAQAPAKIVCAEGEYLAHFLSWRDRRCFRARSRDARKPVEVHKHQALSHINSRFELVEQPISVFGNSDEPQDLPYLLALGRAVFMQSQVSVNSRVMMPFEAMDISRGPYPAGIQDPSCVVSRLRP